MAKRLTDAELLARVPAVDVLDAFYSRHVGAVFLSRPVEKWTTRAG